MSYKKTLIRSNLANQRFLFANFFDWLGKILVGTVRFNEIGLVAINRRIDAYS